MRIQHNIMAMNAYRNYNTNTSALSKNLEKLSSGYKINRAGDDAAGLAISEKMRAQITGLNAAQKNVKDGISLVKTAEGAMQEIQDMLNRMDYLATQSANGTYDDEVDRANLQKEVNQLLSEIDRIADSSNFNGIKLLDGTLDANATPRKTTTLTESTPAAGLTADKLATGTSGTIGTNTILYKDGATATKTKFTIDTSKIEWKGAASGDTMTITVGQKTITLTATSNGSLGSDGTVDVKQALTDAIGSGTTGALSTGGTAAVFDIKFADNKITFEMQDAPTDSTLTTDLDPSQNVTVNTAKTQWNYGTTELQRGVKPVNSTLANTTITAANLGIGTGSASHGATLEVDGKKFIIVDSAKSDDFKDLEGYTKVNVEAGDTAEIVMEKLANAINSAGTVWSAGVDATSGGRLTLAQMSDTDKAKNEIFKDKDKLAATIKVGKYTSTTTTGELTANQQKAKALTLQIGDTSDSFNQLKVSIGDMHVAALGIDGLKIDSDTDAAAAIQKIKDAINQVSSVRGDLGATQNRLEHTANNLSVMAENIQDAESTIRDTDVAEEMMAYTKNNILIQSAQAMLAQANAVPQGVLQLLG